MGSIRAGMLTGTGRRATGEADPGTAHTKAFCADGHAIISNGKVIFVYRRPAAFIVQVYERLDPMIAAVFIVSHGIMGRIQEEFADMGFREKL